jgi:hypothetical protein
MPLLFAALLVASALSQDRRPVPLSPAGSTVVRGRLLDPEGGPLGGKKILLRPIVAAVFAEMPPMSGAFAAPPLDLPFRDTTTAADGSFAFAPIAKGAGCFLSVEFGESGSQVLTIEDVERAPGTDITWRIDPGLRVHGILVDADSGAPIADARIRVTSGIADEGDLDTEKLAEGMGLLYDNSSGGSVWNPPPWLGELLRRGAALAEPTASATCRSAADGSFEVSVGQSKYPSVRLFVRAADHADFEQELEVGHDGPTDDVGTIRLPRLVTARVRVLDEHGRPAPGARVRVASGLEGKEFEPPKPPTKTDLEGLSSDTKERMRELLSTARRQNPLSLGDGSPTDAKGEAEIRVPPSAPAWVAVFLPQRAEWLPTKVESRSGTTEVRIPAPISLSVKTYDAEGKSIDAEIACVHVADVGPCSGIDAMLPIVAPDTLGPGPIGTRSGVATINGLARGFHVVLARAPGFAVGVAEANVDASDASVELRLAPLRAKAIRILGSVDGAERPLAGVRVTWQSESPDDDAHASALPGAGVLETDAQGRIDIPCAAGS